MLKGFLDFPDDFLALVDLICFVHVLKRSVDVEECQKQIGGLKIHFEVQCIFHTSSLWIPVMKQRKQRPHIA